jgi:hypothetical protein
MLFQTVSSISRVNSFQVLDTLGTTCNLSLGVWETHLHTLCPSFVFVIYLKQKQKQKQKTKAKTKTKTKPKTKQKLHVHVCLKILVDLKEL